ncbi:MAG: RDD family protein [Myxococcota bacterium]
MSEASTFSESVNATIEVIGPEGVPVHFARATLSERFIAFAMDLILLVLIATVVLIFFLFAGAGTGLTSVIGIGMIFTFLIRHGYFMFFETHWQGSTPGKRLMKLKVVSRDGSGLSTDAVVARNLMRDLELFVPAAILSNPDQVFGRAPWWLLLPTSLWLFLMVLMPIISRERTRLGDLVGGTLVVRIPIAELQRDEAARTSLVPHADVLTFTLAQLDVYGERELETLAELIRKADAYKATQEDLQVVAVTIAQKIGFGGPLPHQDPGRFLRTFYKQQRAHLEKKLLFGKRKASKFDET